MAEALVREYQVRKKVSPSEFEESNCCPAKFPGRGLSRDSSNYSLDGERQTTLIFGPLEHESAESPRGVVDARVSVAAIPRDVLKPAIKSSSKQQQAVIADNDVRVEMGKASENEFYVAEHVVPLPPFLSPKRRPRGSIHRGESGPQSGVEIGLARTSTQDSVHTTTSVPESPAGVQDTYDKFRTRSARLDSQFSARRGASSSHGTGTRCEGSGSTVPETTEDTDEHGKLSSVQPDRYFDALQGPELETLKEHESELMLPTDERWPFLLRFPIGCFGVCMGLGSQAMLWKDLASSAQLHFLHIPLQINIALWCLALLSLVLVFSTYSLKIIYFFEAVRREFHHPVRVNFFFAPWIACMFLTIGLPSTIASSIHPATWCVFMAPLFILELKIYGQWLSGGDRRLSKVANPSTHLSVVGNFVGALVGAKVGWTEAAIFFWAVGLAHYIVLFVTLYQRLPSNLVLPKDLHPVFFLFVAAPSAASVAWMKITGSFDLVSRLVFFIALFLYSSLVVRINFFRGISFSIAWWAYTFPMTAAAIASIQYTTVADSWITEGLAIVLSVISSATVFTLFIFTILHAFVWTDLFPNDVAIAITVKKSKHKKKGKADDSTDDLQKDSLTALKECEPLHKIMIEAFHQIISKDHNCTTQGHSLESQCTFTANHLK
jgi:tellurite resistance protein TehA-like permease